MRRAGQGDTPATPAEVTQAELDALAATVTALQGTVELHTNALSVYENQFVSLQAQLAQRRNASIRIGVGADVIAPDIGPRYVLQSWRTPDPGPTDALVPLVQPGDVTMWIGKFGPVGGDAASSLHPMGDATPPPIGLTPGWDNLIETAGQIHLGNYDHSAPGTSFLGFFLRPNAWRRQYLLKAVQGGDGTVTAPFGIPLPGAQIGDTVAVFAENEMGSISRLWNDDGTSEDETDPLQIVNGESIPFETTITVADEIQQNSALDLTANSYLIFLCRNPSMEAAAPRDYFMDEIQGSAAFPAAAGLNGCLFGDVVESVIRVTGGALLEVPPIARGFEHAEELWEATISGTNPNNGEIEQVAPADGSFLILYSRPSLVPTPGTPTPIPVVDAIVGDRVESAFIVDQTTGELSELYPAVYYFEPEVTVDNQIIQIAGQLEGRSIAFLLNRAFPPP
jgi:hypothetical protein